MPKIFDLTNKEGEDKGITGGAKLEVGEVFPWTAFRFNPKKIKFETQEEGEEIILFLRQHPVVNISWMLMAAVMFFVPSVLGLLPEWGALPIRFQLMAIVLWYMFVFAFSFENFINWFFNVYIVTNERVVDIDFNGLLYRDISVARIANIEEVNFVQVGSFSAIFDYGNVIVQTAAEKRELTFLRVPFPGKVTEVLFGLMDGEDDNKEGGSK